MALFSVYVEIQGKAVDLICLVFIIRTARTVFERWLCDIIFRSDFNAIKMN